jgi:hypothetical protein
MITLNKISIFKITRNFSVLDLSGNKLKILNQNTFNGLLSIIELKLGFNGKPFGNLNTLKRIELLYNPIIYVGDDTQVINENDFKLNYHLNPLFQLILHMHTYFDDEEDDDKMMIR